PPRPPAPPPRPAGGRRRRRPRGGPRPGAPPAVGWSEVLERLRAAGRDAYLVPTGSADLASAGLHTARVLLTTAQEPGDDH
ncbi:hypothetical protein ACFXKW_35415, partial [Streptomyces sp. NPDC059193]|uniref:hypothetical protein n=1 Tax=Streptomyces sp. NPDC059193 TaxID=3346763 RepID=UPI00367D9B3D